MKINIFFTVLSSFIFAFSLLFDLKLAVALLLMMIFFITILKFELAIIIIFFFIYLVLMGYADTLSFSLSGNQSINLMGILNLTLILIFYVKLLEFRQVRREYWNKRLIYPILLFMLYLVLTVPFSVSLTTSIRGLIRIGSALSFYILAYFIIVNKKNAEEKIFKLITVIFTPLIIYGIIEYIMGYNIFHNRLISVSVFKGWHVVGSFNRIRTVYLGAPSYSFAILTFLPLYLYFIMKRREKRYFYGFILSLLLVNVLLTFTRITWIAIFIQLALFLFLFRPKKILRFALPFGVMFMVISPKIISRATIFDESASMRFDLFKYALSIFKASPVFGSGIDSFSFLYENQFGTTVAAHGDYMKIFAETGILGGIGYLVILFTNITFTVKNFKKNDFAKISFLTIIGFMIFSLIDNGLAYSHKFLGILGVYNGLIVRENVRNYR